MSPEFTYDGEVSRIAFDYGTEFLFVDGAVVRIEGLASFCPEPSKPRTSIRARPVSQRRFC